MPSGTVISWLGEADELSHHGRVDRTGRPSTAGRTRFELSSAERHTPNTSLDPATASQLLGQRTRRVHDGESERFTLNVNGDR